MSVFEQQRRHHRVSCHLPVDLRFASGVRAGATILDMTLYGACVRAEGLQPERGKAVHLSFLANGVPVEVEAVVAWVSGPEQFGVRFANVPPLHQLHIAAYLYARMQMLGYRPTRW